MRLSAEPRVRVDKAYSTAHVTASQVAATVLMSSIE